MVAAVAASRPPIGYITRTRDVVWAAMPLRGDARNKTIATRRRILYYNRSPVLRQITITYNLRLVPQYWYRTDKLS